MKTDGTDKPDTTAETAQKAQDAMGKRMADMQRKKFETRLAKLVAELNLTPEQQQQLRDSMEKRFEAFGSMFTMGSDPHPEEKIKDTMALMKVDAVDETLTGMLQGDQLAKYQEVKVKDQKTKADAKAMKNLANLSTAVDDLTSEQKDAIYQAYSDEAMKSGSAGQGGISQMYEGMGVQMDDELGLQEVMEQQMESPGFGQQDGNPTDMQGMLKKTIGKKIEDRIATLKPILSEAQLQQYRTHLDDKASGMMNMFGGAVPVDPEGGESHSHDTIYAVPAERK